MIPIWNNSGVLPPIRPGMQIHSSERSPYHVSIHDVIETFAFSEKRTIIIKGLLDYREALYMSGITQGFQWIDGSFTENVESLENRPPNDIDVVTFFCLPKGVEQQEFFEQNSSLFTPELTKQKYYIDGYLCLLGEPFESRHVRQISYWYSFWSHRKNGIWKGFLKIDLSQNDDVLAAKVLNFKGSI